MTLPAEPPQGFPVWYPRMIAMLAALLLAQESDARALVQELGADEVPRRERAYRELKKLGPRALPEIHHGTESPDFEIAVRTRRLARVIPIQASLSPRILAAAPGIEERLDPDDDATLTRELVLLVTGKARVDSSDLAPLAERAFRGAREVDDLMSVCELAGEIRALSLAPCLLKLVQGESPVLQSSAFNALVTMGARRELLEVARTSKDRQRRGDAVRTLGDLGAKEEIVALLATGTSDPLLGDAAEQAAWIGARDAVPHLLRILRDENPWVRGQAAAALGALGSNREVPALVRILSDPFGFPRSHAVDALASLGAKEQVPFIRVLLQDPKNTVRVASLRALARLEALDCVADVRAALKDPDPYTRAEAALAIEGLAGKDAVESLLSLLSDDHPGVRCHAASALCRLGSRQGASVLVLEAETDKVYAFQFSDETTVGGELAGPLPFVPLNALRSPGAWEKATALKIALPLEGIVGADLQTLARRGGLKLEVSEEAKASLAETRWHWGSDAREASLAFLLQRVCRSREREIVLEEGRLRVLARREGREFWKAWLSR